MKEKSTPYALLAKFFASQCSPSEAEQVLSWCNENEDNQRLFDDLQLKWQQSESDQAPSIVLNKEKIWNNIQKHIHNKIVHLPSYTRTHVIRIAGVAAMIAFIIGTTLSVILHNTLLQPQTQQMVVTAPSGQKSQLKLPDGTLVWLNSGSQITYSSDFNTRNRFIDLEGEAYFEVTKSTKSPFIVKTNYVDVKVLGTKFNVRSYTDEQQLLVTLVKGKVELLSSASQKVLTRLDPNQTATIQKKNLFCNVESSDAEMQSLWHNNKLLFDNISQTEVWKSLERWYGVKIAVKNSDQDLKYRFTLKKESLTEVLTLINRITPIDYKINGEEVFVSYK